mmetsp:Transcript_34769/g.40251  ORF Transcript_34769/g.40251 Transcript_34769/m.40251 type:complete len:135 (+) Transcript_34769:740-1144(+)
MYIYTIKRNDLKVTCALKLAGNPIKVNFFPVTRDEIAMLRTDKNEIFISKITFGFSNKNSLSWSTMYHSVWEEEVKGEDTIAVQKSEFKVVSEGKMKESHDNNPYWRRRPYIYAPFYQMNNAIHSVDVSNSLAA